MDARTDYESMTLAAPVLRARVAQHLAAVYADGDVTAEIEQLTTELLDIMRLDAGQLPPGPMAEHWDQGTALAIAYGDSIMREGEFPLQTLKAWLDRKARSEKLTMTELTGVSPVFTCCLSTPTVPTTASR